MLIAPVVLADDIAVHTWTHPYMTTLNNLQVVGELGLGDDDLDEQKTPAIVVRKEGGSWAAVDAACGGQHCLALLRNKSSPPVPVEEPPAPDGDDKEKS